MWSQIRWWVASSFVLCVIPVLWGQEPAPSPTPAEPPTINGVPLIPWGDAAKYYDREVILYGRTVMTRNIGKYVFINFHSDFRQHFTVLIKQEDLKNFPEPPEKAYARKLVAVRGKVIKYQNKPEIVISNPNQILVLPDDTADIPAALKNQAPTAPPAQTQQPPQSKPTDAKPVGSIPTGEVFSVATVDLGELLEGKESSDPGAEGGQPSPDSRMTEVAVMIRNLNADVVAVHGNMNQAGLERFNAEFLADMNYTQVVGEEHQGRIFGALLSRVPVNYHRLITEQTDKKGETVSFARPFLLAGMMGPDGSVLHIYVVDFPTNGDGLSKSDVIAQVRAIGQVIRDNQSLRSDQGSVLVCGGFHGSLDDSNVQALIQRSEVKFTVPGYTPSVGKEADKPAIAKVNNFILASPSMSGLYASGSTRIEERPSLPGATVVGFQKSSNAASVTPQTPPTPANTDTTGGF